MKKRKTSKSHYVKPLVSVLPCISEGYILTGTFQGGHHPTGGGSVIGDNPFDGGHGDATGGFVIGDAEDNGGHGSATGGKVLGDEWQ